MQKWFLGTLNFGKRCPKPHEQSFQLKKKWQMSYSCAELTILLRSQKRWFCHHSPVHSQDQSPSIIVMPYTHLLSHKNTGTDFLYVYSHRKKVLCTFHTLLTGKTLEWKYYPNNWLWTCVKKHEQIFRILSCHEMSCKHQMIPPEFSK